MPKIVVVDDEPDILATLVKFLEEHVDAEVVGFDAAEPALSYLQDREADLLLADYRMPGMDGLELIRRSHEAIPDLGTMIITAYPDIDLAIRAINEGHIMHFFTKPPEPKELTRAVHGFLVDLRRLQDRRAAFQRALETARASLGDV